MARTDVTTPAFWKDTAERVFATFLQVLVPALGIEAGASGLHEVSWLPALSVSAAAAVLALIKCLIAGLTGGSPSAVKVAQHDRDLTAKRERLQADIGQRPAGESGDSPDAAPR